MWIKMERLPDSCLQQLVSSAAPRVCLTQQKLPAPRRRVKWKTVQIRPGERRDAGFHEIIRTSDSNTCAVMPRRSRRPKLIKEAPGFISFGRISHRTFQHPERACRTCHRTLTLPEFPPDRARKPLAVQAGANCPLFSAPGLGFSLAAGSAGACTTNRSSASLCRCLWCRRRCAQRRTCCLCAPMLLGDRRLNLRNRRRWV